MWGTKCSIFFCRPTLVSCAYITHHFSAHTAPIPQPLSSAAQTSGINESFTSRCNTTSTAFSRSFTFAPLLTSPTAVSRKKLCHRKRLCGANFVSSAAAHHSRQTVGDNKEPCSSNPTEGKPRQTQRIIPENTLLCWKLRGGKKNSRALNGRAGQTHLTCGVKSIKHIERHFSSTLLSTNSRSVQTSHLNSCFKPKM